MDHSLFTILLIIAVFIMITIPLTDLDHCKYLSVCMLFILMQLLMFLYILSIFFLLLLLLLLCLEFFCSVRTVVGSGWICARSGLFSFSPRGIFSFFMD